METTRVELAELCRFVTEDLPESLACGVVGLREGKLIAGHRNGEGFPQSRMENLAQAATRVFNGSYFQQLMPSQEMDARVSRQAAFEEFFVASDQVFYFMKLIPEMQAVLVLATTQTMKEGLGWTTMKFTLRQIETHLQGHRSGLVELGP